MFVMIQGLRYDDLYDPYFDLDIKEALARLPREVVDARIQRLKRAMDLSMKHQYLSDDLQVSPFLPRSEGSLSIPVRACGLRKVDAWSLWRWWTRRSFSMLIL